MARGKSTIALNDNFGILFVKFCKGGMTLIKVCICDDESEQRRMLKGIIKTQLELTGQEYDMEEFSSGEEVIRAFEKQRTINGAYDILFLDIEMGGIDGIETAKRIRAIDEKVILIFVTGYANYVFNGYDVKALNYVMKPYKEEKIKEVFKEAVKLTNKALEKYFGFNVNGNYYKIPEDNILYFYSDKRKIILEHINGKNEFYGKLNDIELELSDNFFRIHQRYLVNLKHVESLEDKDVVIRNNKLPISRGNYQDTVSAFTKTFLS